ncbi:hypothetical protein BpHYR1_021481 [Brachionus plicatilis]|uniref:Uncharacterized protein n=1 Tax=Brachionus plicatilis TaxID=10195 RepID=A0A3M7QBL3_BRAPC|nr:hypothetical protein BpHYR1_021481 [Brachionus plicatilis]
MAAISTSQETLNVVKKALSKHANPVPCEICGELMKNIIGVFFKNSTRQKSEKTEPLKETNIKNYCLGISTLRNLPKS